MDLEEDLAVAKGKLPSKQTENQKKPKSRPVAKQRTLKELLKEKGGKSSSEEEEEDDQHSEEENSFRDEILNEASDEDLDDSRNEEDDDEDNCDEEFGNEDVEDNEEVKDKEVQKGQKKKPKVWQDIYGRLRDESGGVLKSSEASKQAYVPPKLRKESSTEDENKKEKCLRIRRQLKGLLNR